MNKFRKFPASTLNKFSSDTIKKLLTVEFNGIFCPYVDDLTDLDNYDSTLPDITYNMFDNFDKHLMVVPGPLPNSMALKHVRDVIEDMKEIWTTHYSDDLTKNTYPFSLMQEMHECSHLVVRNNFDDDENKSLVSSIYYHFGKPLEYKLHFNDENCEVGIIHDGEIIISPPVKYSLTKPVVDPTNYNPKNHSSYGIYLYYHDLDLLKHE